MAHGEGLGFIPKLIDGFKVTKKSKQQLCRIYIILIY